MMRKIACEVGNFDTKLVGEEYIKDNTQVITVLNMVSEGKDRRDYGGKVKNPINLLDVTIETKADPISCGRWFVGGLAFSEGSMILKPTSEDKKSENPLTIIQLLTTVAFYLYEADPKNPKRTESIKLSTCLPTEEYWSTDELDYVAELMKRLPGTHKVKFNDKSFNGAEITINIDKVLVNPEGTAGQMAITYDWDGNVLKEMVGMEHKTIMNIDIGSIDVNVSIQSNGDFVEKGFFGIKGGTTEVLRQIAKEIKDNKKYGYEPDPHKIDYHLRTGKPLYIGDIEVKDLKEIAARQYAKAAWSLSNKITNELKDKGIEKHEISIMNMNGGGTEWMKNDFIKHFTVPNMKVQSPKQPRFANVEGALKALMFEEMEAAAASDEVFEQE